MIISASSYFLLLFPPDERSALQGMPHGIRRSAEAFGRAGAPGSLRQGRFQIVIPSSRAQEASNAAADPRRTTAARNSPRLATPGTLPNCQTAGSLSRDREHTVSGRRHGGKSFVLSLREWDRWRQELLADRCGLLLTYSTWERGARLAIHGAISSELPAWCSATITLSLQRQLEFPSKKLRRVPPLLRS